MISRYQMPGSSGHTTDVAENAASDASPHRVRCLLSPLGPYGQAESIRHQSWGHLDIRFEEDVRMRDQVERRDPPLAGDERAMLRGGWTITERR